MFTEDLLVDETDDQIGEGKTTPGCPPATGTPHLIPDDNYEDPPPAGAPGRKTTPVTNTPAARTPAQRVNQELVLNGF